MGQVRVGLTARGVKEGRRVAWAVEEHAFVALAALTFAPLVAMTAEPAGALVATRVAISARCVSHPRPDRRGRRAVLGAGPLGNGDLGPGSNTPTNVTGLTSGVMAVSNGYWDTCALTTRWREVLGLQLCGPARRRHHDRAGTPRST